MPHKGAYRKPDEETRAKAEDMRRVVDVPAFRPQHGEEGHAGCKRDQYALQAAQVGTSMRSAQSRPTTLNMAVEKPRLA